MSKLGDLIALPVRQAGNGGFIMNANDRAVAAAGEHGAAVARAINAHDALVEALRGLLKDLTETARNSYEEWPEPGGRLAVFTDEMWQRQAPDDFALAQQARAALKLAGEP